MKRFLFLMAIITLLLSCSPSPDKEDRFEIVTWNMCEFFDYREDGDEYAGWRESDGWNDTKYNERIKKCVMYMVSNFKDADVIVLEEVESSEVLISLLEGGMKKEGYLYYGIASDDSNLSVAFISRIKPVSLRLLFVPSARPMLSFDFNINGEMVRVIGVHLRTRLKDENEEIRREELLMLKDEADNCDFPLIVLGDFNIDPVIHKEEMCDTREGETTLPLTGDGSRAFGGRLFSPYLDYNSPLSGGTYYFEGQWERLDNILLSSSFFDGEGIEYEGTTIIKGGDSIDCSGRPLKYDKSTGKGMSDHFALKSTFRL